MPFEPPGKVQFQQDHEDLRRMKAGVRMSSSTPTGVGPKRLDQAFAV